MQADGTRVDLAGVPVRRMSCVRLTDLRSLHDWTLILWSIVVADLLIVLGLSASGSDLHAGLFAANFLRMANLDAHDSWMPMMRAIEHLRADNSVPVYQALFFGEQIKFQYPISSLVVLDMIQRFGRLHWETVYSLLNRVSWYSVWLAAFVSWRLFLGAHARVRGESGVSGASSADELHLLWPCLALTVLFYPLVKSFNLGQIQTAMALLAAAALLAWQSDRKVLAGLCIGVCCAVKPQWAIILVWGALRREWAMVAAAGAAAAVFVLSSAALYGAHHYVDYLSVLSYLSQHGEAYYPNQSVNGLLNRLTFNGQSLVFDVNGFPDYHPVVYAGSLAASAAILAIALWPCRSSRTEVCDLAAIMLAATMASPIAWEHHYAILLPIFALLAPLAAAEKPLGRWTIPALVLMFLTASQLLAPTNRLAGTVLNVAQSYLFFAAALTFAVLLRLRRSAAPRSAGAGQRVRCRPGRDDMVMRRRARLGSRLG